MLKKTHTLSFLFAFILLIGGGSLTAAQGQIERTFEVAPGGLLRIDAERASIEVESGAASQLVLEIEAKGWGRDDLEDDFDIRFNQSGNQVTLEIEARRKASRWFSFGNKGLKVHAYVPSRFDVDLKTSGGSISVDDLQGEVRSATSGGSLTFGRIDGMVWGRTSGGSIRLQESSGPVDVHTSGGSIRIGDVQASVEAVTSGGSIEIARTQGSVSAKTSGGSIHVEEVLGHLEARTSGGSISAAIAAQPEEDCYLSTSGGNVTVELAEGLGFDVDAKASGGRVSSDMSVAIRGSIGKNTLRGQLNRGGPKLTLRTSGGGIKIRGMGR